MYTSTQVVNGKEGIANNSGVRQEEKIKQLEAQIKTLTEKIECKDGEVSILRTRIKELKVHSEQEKNEKENLQKIAALNREILAIKSQLDFKVRFMRLIFNLS